MNGEKKGVHPFSMYKTKTMLSQDSHGNEQHLTQNPIFGQSAKFLFFFFGRRHFHDYSLLDLVIVRIFQSFSSFIFGSLHQRLHQSCAINYYIIITVYNRLYIIIRIQIIVRAEYVKLNWHVS